MLKIWHKVTIVDNEEKLIGIPSSFKFFTPHPYYNLGAPYDRKSKIWILREGVVKRLIKVNEYLESKNNGLCLLIYDSWRPIEVQQFMFSRAFTLECKKLDIKADVKDMAKYPNVQKTVENFWAYPSFDERCPPPHSTGGAVDITFSDKKGNIIDMGSNIDQMDEKSKPDFYKDFKEEEAIIFNDRRNLLKEVMLEYEFVQHPNEWWHFSYGDQLWAWKKKKASAFYGRI